MRPFAKSQLLTMAAILLPVTLLFAANVDTKFHNAPASAQATKNPYEARTRPRKLESNFMRAIACHATGKWAKARATCRH